jgi:hypothetical protein
MKMQENARLRYAVGDNPFHGNAAERVRRVTHIGRRLERGGKALCLRAPLHEMRVGTAHKLRDHLANLIDRLHAASPVVGLPGPVPYGILARP